MEPINDISVDLVRDLFDYRDGRLWRRKRTSGRSDMSKPAGYLKKSRGYREISINGRSYQEHRLVWLHQKGEWPCQFIDHINGDKGDNRIDNLRNASKSQNRCNTPERVDNVAGVKGVHQVGGRWRAQIQINGHKKHIGYFGTKEAAQSAYFEKAQELHGEFARFE